MDTIVPASPRSIAPASTSEPIAAKPPVFAANWHAASTFGFIEPEGNQCWA